MSKVNPYWSCVLEHAERRRCPGYIEYAKCSGECPDYAVERERTRLLWRLLIVLFRLRFRRHGEELIWKIGESKCGRPADSIEVLKIDQEVQERLDGACDQVRDFQRKLLSALMVPAEFLGGYPSTRGRGPVSDK